MKHLLFLFLMLPLVSCQVTFSDPSRDEHCDDGTAISCRALPPDCPTGTILAHQLGCYECVDPDSCEPSGGPDYCTGDLDCDIGQWCYECAGSSCPECADCVPGCVDHSCPTEAQASCESEQPECGMYGVAVVRDGCWLCVDAMTCEELELGPCDDGSEVLCDMAQLQCEEGLIVAVQDSCYVCVDPNTCQVPLPPTSCYVDADCAMDHYCNPCASSSCPTCNDCIPECVPHDCEFEDGGLQFYARPECEPGTTAVVRGGTWTCVDIATCEESRASWCDDGTVPSCNLLIMPECQEGEILAHQDECYFCVNAATCLPFGDAGCETDMDCTPHEMCSSCGTGSCAGCDDCVSACIAHHCPTEPAASCYMARSDCGPEGVAVVQNGCWQCVYTESCITADATN